MDNQYEVSAEAARWRMVEQQLRARDIVDERVLAAMGKVARHLFVEPALEPYAYEDRPLSIGAGQTISQPYIVALMVQLLRVQPWHLVLEVGTGSGYQAAILAELAAEVYTVEIIPSLAESAAPGWRLSDTGMCTPDRGMDTRDGRRSPHLTGLWSLPALLRSPLP